MLRNTLLIIFTIIVKDAFCSGGLSRVQQAKRKGYVAKPIVFESNAERVRELEQDLNAHLDNILSKNNIKVAKVDREFSIKDRSPVQSYSITLKNEEKECPLKATLSFPLSKCDEHKEKCLDVLSNCIKELSPSVNKVEIDEEPLKNKSESEQSEQEVPKMNTQEVQTEEIEEENPVHETLIGGYNPCTNHDLKRVHGGLMYLQKYAWLNFEHLYLENISLCSQQFFYKSSNYNILMAFDTTEKCQLNLNIQYDGEDENEYITGVNVYQNSGEEPYSIFKRNPVLSTDSEHPDCATLFATSLYRMTLEKYNNMDKYAAKRKQMEEKLNKRK